MKLVEDGNDHYSHLPVVLLIQGLDDEGGDRDANRSEYQYLWSPGGVCDVVDPGMGRGAPGEEVPDISGRRHLQI